jgi:DNA-binding NarL/FixJ family response regulator
VSAMPVRILLADDHALVRHGLRMVLDAEPDLRVTAEAGDGIEAVRAGLEHDLDLAIIDIAMPRMTGLHVARELHRQRPAVRLLMLSMHENERYREEALRAGASAYVLKTVADRELVEACRAVMRGESFLPSPRAAADAGSDEPAADPLTPREREVVKLIAEGCSGREIAEMLVISEKTVERHRANVLRKLKLRGSVALTRYAVRHGLIEP